MLGISIIGMVTCIYSVKVNVSIKEDVKPEHIREIREFQSDDKIVLGLLHNDDIVCFKGQGVRIVRVKGIEGNRDAGPSKKGFIDWCICTAVDSWTMGVIDRAFEVNRGV